MKDELRTFRDAQTARKIMRLQLAEIEKKLRKLPDFQRYMVAAAPRDRERMERLLTKLPAFRAWCRLSQRAGELAPDKSEAQ